MKKIVFFSIMLFVLIQGSFAQTRLGVAAGATAWTIKDNDENINNPISGGFRIGMLAETKIWNSFSLSLSPTYFFLKGGANYEVDNYYLPPGHLLPDPSYIDDDVRFLNQFFHANRHQLALALKAIATIKMVRPFVGMEFTNVRWKNNYDPNLRRSNGDLGVVAGFSCKISNSIEFDVEYYNTSFTQRQNESEHTRNYSYGFKRLTFGVRYFLRTFEKKKKEEVAD